MQQIHVMSDDLDGMHETIREVHNTNTFILKRLEHITTLDESNNTACTCKGEGKQKLKEAISSVQKLEGRAKHRDNVINKMIKEIKALQDHITELNQTPGEGISSKQHEEECMDEYSDLNEISNKHESAIRAYNVVVTDCKAKEAVHSDQTVATKIRNANKDSDHITQSNQDNTETHTRSSTQQSDRKAFQLPQTSDHDPLPKAKQETPVDAKKPVSIKTPNFEKRTAVQKTGVKMVKQTEKKCVLSHTAWDLLGAQEQNTGTQEVKDLEGVNTVICIDISASMADDEAWVQAKTFFTDYIGGLEDMANEHDIREENIALVTFGHETRVVQRFTNDISKIRQAFGNLKLGGPSPIYGGLMMAVAAAESSDRRVALVNGIHVSTKIVLITDGKPTDENMYAGPDVEDIKGQEQTKSNILRMVEKMQNYLDLFCVPVGKANMDFIELMASVADGKMLRFKEGRQLSRRLFLTLKSNQDPLGLFGGLSSSPSFMSRLHSDLSESDKMQMQEIMENGRKHMFAALEKNKHREATQYMESDSKTLPTIGSRVIRGPDWSWKLQDSNGPGTVIGHDSNGGQAWVEWDADEHRNVYHYGGSGRYDILLDVKPRVLRPGCKLAVGCVVKQGKHWNHGYSKVSANERGVVIKMISESKKVQVRWNNRERGEYSHGENGIYEIELSSPTEPDTTADVDEQPREKVPPKLTRNKNKNIS